MNFLFVDVVCIVFLLYSPREAHRQYAMANLILQPFYKGNLKKGKVKKLSKKYRIY